MIDHVSTILANTTPKSNHFAYILKIATEDNWPKKAGRISAQVIDTPGQPIENINRDEDNENKEIESERKCGMPAEMREELTRKYGFNKRE